MEGELAANFIFNLASLHLYPPFCWIGLKLVKALDKIRGVIQNFNAWKYDCSVVIQYFQYFFFFFLVEVVIQ